MAGRPPKPTILKQLAGNPGKRALNDAEPRPPAKRPPCPPHLVGEARKEWNRMAKQLLELGLLTSVDRAALAAYCQAWAQWIEAHEKLAELGMIVKTESGYPVLSPWWTVATQSAKQMKSFLTEFGMTPGSRSRLRVNTDTKKLTVQELLDAAVND
jgi:P27 family predicted phage terminase small subunit